MAVDDRRAARAVRTPPSVVVRCAGDTAVLRDLRAGLEEEGVPVRVEDGGSGDAVALAFGAAQASSLDVGIGVAAGGAVCVHHAKRPPDSPALTGTARDARLLGHNAARLVTGIPVKTS
ncbi:glycerol dehydratase reactivase beta/small subunit family protein [Prauserella flavalba]|uniref:PduH protein n=1 Tax=Prauserella flavalba TaxID=1477506 RepID=A0A318LTR1_9PSEU|nr:glycerol dehydratase reactivase beta/small subunit family protein [Prauserella flavalba]PXY35728.1 hypothetical protein BA062_09545 [Prauserella flavalba]